MNRKRYSSIKQKAAKTSVAERPRLNLPQQQGRKHALRHLVYAGKTLYRNGLTPQ
jgi:hypothetical protein